MKLQNIILDIVGAAGILASAFSSQFQSAVLAKHPTISVVAGAVILVLNRLAPSWFQQTPVAGK
jgi:uncharacterized membrane protein YeaQ/YmgE (transglycosylase-associated protein family)